METVNFTVFNETGGEEVASGEKWSDGPRVGGQWTIWVVPDAPMVCVSPAVAVVAVSRRHRVGKVVRGHWRAKGGRYVDKGDAYTELAPTSHTGRLTFGAMAPPTCIHVKALDLVIFRILSAQCPRCGGPPVGGTGLCLEHSE